MKSFLVSSALILSLGCSHQQAAKDPGPAQRTGASLDEGAESAKESAKSAGEKVGHATEKAGAKLKDKSEQ